MRTMFSKMMMATAIGATTLVGIAAPADARHRHNRKHYHSQSAYNGHYCRHSSATTGAIAGGVGGAVLGNQVLGHGLLGAGAGAVAGVVAGKAIDRTLTARRRCR